VAVEFRPADWNQMLTSPHDFHGFDDPETKWEDAFRYLERRLNIRILIDEKSFAAEGLEVRTNPIGREIPKLRASFGTVLRTILARIPVESGAVFALRPNGIEITTTAALRAELGMPAHRSLLPLVWDAFDNTPVDEALGRVSQFTGFSVVIDPRAAEQVRKTKTNAELNNVPADTAVRLLANMAGQSVVRMDNVFYVTTRENAVALRAEQEQVNTDKSAAPQTEKPVPGKSGM
jgi:hypothetical protein